MSASGWCTWSGGCTGLGGVPGLGGCTWSWGVYLVLGGVPALGGSDTPPVNRMTNRCKNITLPQTSFAGGKYSLQIERDSVLTNEQESIPVGCQPPACQPDALHNEQV